MCIYDPQDDETMTTTQRMLVEIQSLVKERKKSDTFLKEEQAELSEQLQTLETKMADEQGGQHSRKMFEDMVESLNTTLEQSQKFTQMNQSLVRHCEREIRKVVKETIG